MTQTKYLEIPLFPVENQIVNFLKKIKVVDTFGCWEWIGARSKTGYGTFFVGKKCFLAHRIAFLWLGDNAVPCELVVRHICDNPVCCNPLHLELGTQQDNVNDRIARGREKHPSGKDHWKIANPEAQKAALINQCRGEKLSEILRRVVPRGDDHFMRKFPERRKNGQDNPAAKLSDDQCKLIKERLAKGEVGRKLAKEFGVSPQQISKINLGLRRKIK